MMLSTRRAENGYQGNKSNSADVKIVVLGKEGVGKSAVTVRYLTRRYIGEYDSSKDSVYRFDTTIDEDSVSMEIMDPSSKIIDKSDRFSWGDGFLLVYSVTDKRTFDDLFDLRQHIVNIKTPIRPAFVLLGNKSDFVHKRQITREDGENLADEMRCSFFECSAAEGYKEIAQAFHQLYRDVIRKRKERKMARSPQPLRHALSKVFGKGGKS